MRTVNKRRLLVENQDHEQKEKIPWRWGILDFLLRVSLIRNVGLRNALDVRMESVELVFSHLPKGFNNVRILFLTDLHLDETNLLADKVINVVGGIDYDYCILGRLFFRPAWIQRPGLLANRADSKNTQNQIKSVWDNW